MSFEFPERVYEPVETPLERKLRELAPQIESGEVKIADIIVEYTEKKEQPPIPENQEESQEQIDVPKK